MSKGISVSKIYREVGYSPHRVQKTIHAAARDYRFRVVCAGRRTGKSTLGGHELTPKAIAAFYRWKSGELDPYNRRSEHWIIGPEYSDAEKEFRVLWADMQRYGLPMESPGSYYDPIGGNLHIKLWGGAFQVHGKSAKYPTTLVGEALESVILAEAAKLKPAIWSKYVRPMLADYKGTALMTSTPEGKNWFYEMWQIGQARRSGFWSIRMPSWSNDIIFPGGRYDEEILSMSAGMSEEKFKQEIGAEFTEFVGRVFKDFDEETHVVTRSYNPNLPVYIGTDYGFTNPNVALFIQHDIWDNVAVVGEYYQRSRTPSEFAREVLEDPYLSRMVSVARGIYPDPADPGASATLSEAWRVPVRSHTGGEIQERLELIRRFLSMGPDQIEFDRSNAEWVPRLVFDRFRCPNTIREMQDYRYPEDKNEADSVNSKEKPLSKDDHCPEALGRFMRGHYGKLLARNAARQKTAKVG